ncbi:GNAT family protein [Streptomyces cyaneofuscatus]|uniref:GNAT family N-acetyltransferase n=1 Tax=Streptomyces TaxID=1883 RepID=UPI0022426DAF|nr:GNAT family protein [Streptomyces sp. VB1]UZI27973.1 GNAT family N-acetyltransferase [Streptomyces sp. VB1]
MSQPTGPSTARRRQWGWPTRPRPRKSADEPMPDLWISTDACGLGPYRSDLLETYWKWEQAPFSMLGHGRRVPLSLEHRKDWLDRQLKDDGQIRFTVYDLASATPVPAGFAVLDLDHTRQTAEYALLVAPKSRGKGLGRHATRLTVDYGFHVSGLHAISLRVLTPHVTARAIYRACGFREAGRLRSAGVWLGARCDEEVMDMVPADFVGPSMVSRYINSSPIQA